jgi:hypothetical protein
MRDCSSDCGVGRRSSLVTNDAWNTLLPSSEFKQFKTRLTLYVQCNIEACSGNDCYCGKALSITSSECVCRLSYPVCNAHAPYCHLWTLALQYFSTLSHKRQDLKNTKYVNLFSLFQIYFILGITVRHLIIKVYGSPRETPGIPARF